MSINSRRPIHYSQEHLPDETSSVTTDESLPLNSDSEETYNSSNISVIKKKSPMVKRNVSRKSTESPTKQQYTKETVSPKKTAGNSRFRFYLHTFIVGLIMIIIFIIMWILSGTSEKVTVIERCNYSELVDKYKNEDEYLWNHLTSGIQNILNGRSDKPAVFLFVHSGGQRTKELIKDIAETSSTCFDSSMKPVEINIGDFISEDAVNDYGNIIEKYKQKIQEGNVILICNLNEIPGKAARALHFICDTHSPIVPKLIIFLSLVAENKGERVVDTAQEVLRELWESTISRNEFDPLLTRVTDDVILLQSK